ncbi:MAG: hypothetical protein H7833_11990 [Magnetococcus sp. DMHC-1]
MLANQKSFAGFSHADPGGHDGIDWIGWQLKNQYPDALPILFYGCPDKRRMTIIGRGIGFEILERLVDLCLDKYLA